MKTLIFGGTTEGRQLARLLAANGADVTLCVATEYGRENAARHLRVLAKRLDTREMAALMRENAYECVVDATHPYADEATRNIGSACAETGTRYLRLLRGGSDRPEAAVYVPDAAEAARYLNTVQGNVLLMVGSKELAAFTAVKDYETRLYVRIAPMEESLGKALRLGYANAHIICMQGPFDADMNAATISMTGAKYIVTKDSGETGGFPDKLLAAERTGCRVIVIARPVEESGYTFDELMDLFNIPRGGGFTYFPLFINMEARRVAVIGAGKVAERRVTALAACGADITVVSPRATKALYELAAAGRIRHVPREYAEGDIAGAFLAIAATDCAEVNRAVMREANAAGVPVIVSDSRELCDCWFPAIAESAGYMAGVVSKNGDHAGVRQTARRVRGVLQ